MLINCTKIRLLVCSFCFLILIYTYCNDHKQKCIYLLIPKFCVKLFNVAFLYFQVIMTPSDGILFVLALLPILSTTSADTCDLCEWLSWNSWGNCSRTCKGGYVLRSRNLCCENSTLFEDLSRCVTHCKEIGKEIKGSYVQNSTCNHTCLNGGTRVLWDFSCVCRHGYTGECCETGKQKKKLYYILLCSVNSKQN